MGRLTENQKLIKTKRVGTPKEVDVFENHNQRKFLEGCLQTFSKSNREHVRVEEMERFTENMKQVTTFP